MGTLDEFLNSILTKEFRPARLIARLIAKKLRQQGVILSEDQIQAIEADLSDKQPDQLHIELTEEQKRTLSSSTLKDDSDLQIKLTEDDTNEAIERITASLPNIIISVTDIVAERLLEAWKADAGRIIGEEKENISQFTSEILEFWGEAIRLLEILRSVCLETGSNFNNEVRPDALKQGDSVFEALTRLHARGCQICAEIILLLKGGFADGAYARWRTLHEISVIAMFIKDRGSVVAERYLYHRAIEN